jgi:hypothetical protein
MLVSVSVSNFRSFAGRQTFSLLTNRRLRGSHETHGFPVPDSPASVLRVGVIFGAVGAGKSNLLDSLRYARTIALELGNVTGGTVRSPFRLADMGEKPTTLDLRFIAADKLYRYGFSIDDKCIVEERLVHVIGSKERPIYKRRTDASGKVKIDAPGLMREGARLRAVVTVAGRRNQTFLATVRMILERQDMGADLSEVIKWFESALIMVGPATSPSTSREQVLKDWQFRKFAGDFLRAASVGIDRLTVERKEVSRQYAQLLARKEVLARALREAGARGTSVLRTLDGEELLIERTVDGEHFYRVAVLAVHKDSKQNESVLPLSEESDGTRRLLDLVLALYQLKSGATVGCIDDIERSLHPMLVHKFIDYFVRMPTDTPSQIIVATHQLHSMDLDLLRRDEIWFAARHGDGATNLRPLSDYRIRSDLRLDKRHLEGRFGAVPFLAETDRLSERSTSWHSQCPELAHVSGPISVPISRNRRVCACAHAATRGLAKTTGPKLCRMCAGTRSRRKLRNSRAFATSHALPGRRI